MGRTRGRESMLRKILNIIAVLMILIPIGYEQSEYKVKRIIDGDTIVLSDNTIIRYIGIDCPELNTPNGKIAKHINDSILTGKILKIEYDKSRYDRYSRTLGYVYTVANTDTVFINTWLIQHGYAVVMTVPPNVKYQYLFGTLENQAKINHRGFWK
jgi:micrococcal nuclease